MANLFTLIDLETTGLFPSKYDKITEISLKKVNKNGELIDKSFIKSNNFKSLREIFYKMIKDKKKHKKMINNNFKKIYKYSKKYFTKKIIEELEFMR